MKQQITTARLAARWGVHRSTINRYRTEGLLHPLGKRGAGLTATFVYAMSEVERFERENHLLIQDATAPQP